MFLLLTIVSSSVDDCPFFSCSEGAIDRLLKSISDDKAPDKLSLDVESDVASFLGILLNKQDDGSIELKQTGLIEHILQVMSMEDLCAVRSPTKVILLAPTKMESLVVKTGAIPVWLA